MAYLLEGFKRLNLFLIDCERTKIRGTPLIRYMWYRKTEFKSRVHRKQELIRFVNYYNTVKPHKGINNLTPLEKLIELFLPQRTVNNAAISYK